MSSDLTQPAVAPASTVDAVSPDSKGKGKAPVQDQPMEEDVAEGDDDDDEDDGDEDEDEEEDAAEETYDEIDPTAIVSGRRNRPQVDYTSKEAHEKAGLRTDDADEDEDEDVHMG